MFDVLGPKHVILQKHTSLYSEVFDMLLFNFQLFVMASSKQTRTAMNLLLVYETALVFYTADVVFDGIFVPYIRTLLHCAQTDYTEYY